MRRVVVTGIGLLTPLGQGRELSWKAILAGKSGAGRITTFDPSDYACQVACEVPRVDGRGGGGADVEGSFDPDQTMAPKDQRRVDDFILYAMAAADEAVKDSGWQPEDDEGRERTGVIIGSGIGGLATIEKNSVELHEKGPRRISPFFIPSALINLASGQVSIRYGFKGPNHSVVTACATGAHAIGDAARLIAFDDADVMIAGGAESAICRLGIAGFIACKALATKFNDAPETASRAYDKNRDGFVMGEGAGVVVLETLEHALARGAKIYGELAGYGATDDAYHITAPSPEAKAASRAMQLALADGGLRPEDVDYVNAHGTSTELNDKTETFAIKKVFGDHAKKLAVSSTKSMTGHLLGGAGGIESVFTVLAVHHQIAPPTINLFNQDPECDLDYCANTAREMKIEYAAKNNFGFGGTNGTLIFKRA